MDSKTGGGEFRDGSGCPSNFFVKGIFLLSLFFMLAIFGGFKRTVTHFYFFLLESDSISGRRDDGLKLFMVLKKQYFAFFEPENM